MSVLLEAAVCLSIPMECEQRTLVRRMSVPALSSEVQLRYLLQWFSEFSELQKEDFLPILAAARGEKSDQLENALAFLNCHDKPVSLFQCRIKLFNDWYPTWSADERGRLEKGITEMDTDFAKKLLEYDMTNGKVNGEVNGLDDTISPEEAENVRIVISEEIVDESEVIPTNDEAKEHQEEGNAVPSAPEIENEVDEVQEKLHDLKEEEKDDEEVGAVTETVTVEIVATS